MRLILVDRNTQAHQIWKTLKDPDHNVVLALDPKYVGLLGLAPIGTQHGFVPTWGVLDEKAFKGVLRHAKTADKIVSCQLDPWVSHQTHEALNGLIPKSKFVYARLQNMDTDSILSCVDLNLSPDPRALERGVRHRIADHLIGTALRSGLKKVVRTSWCPTFREFVLFCDITRSHMLDRSSTTQDNQTCCGTPNLPTVCDLLVRRSAYEHLSVTRNRLTELFDMGLVGHATDALLDRTVTWVRHNLDPTARAPTSIVSSELLVPLDIELDIQNVCTQYRDLYLDIWQHTIDWILGKTIPSPPHVPYGALERYIVIDPMSEAERLIDLQMAGLVGGRAYQQLTSFGMLICATIQQIWPSLQDPSILGAIESALSDEADRTEALGLLWSTLQDRRKPKLPTVSTLCPECRAVLFIVGEDHHTALKCSNSQCAAVWPLELSPERHIGILVDHNAPRWCDRHKITMHHIVLNRKTHEVTQHCVACAAPILS